MTNQQNDICTQRRLRSAWISAKSDQSSLCAHCVAKGPSYLHANSEDSDQTGQMPRLIWVFAGCTCHFVGFVMRYYFVWFLTRHVLFTGLYSFWRNWQKTMCRRYIIDKTIVVIMMLNLKAHSLSLQNCSFTLIKWSKITKEVELSL